MSHIPEKSLFYGEGPITVPVTLTLSSGDPFDLTGFTDVRLEVRRRPITDPAQTADHTVTGNIVDAPLGKTSFIIQQADNQAIGLGSHSAQVVAETAGGDIRKFPIFKLHILASTNGN